MALTGTQAAVHIALARQPQLWARLQPLLAVTHEGTNGTKEAGRLQRLCVVPGPKKDLQP
ncbi:hypothetical protein CHLRE_02g094426v5 [Chlamydomonas reinhardtii]|uniref:Uncharacterized protein n=1 Tax=Chlamydomonas reinhardtii TaxID=3055 RepID=A0A2K3E1D5_CHLRE|nr:uncharacterized protein CHLRE_02g094426v5 [Chlamydomonas reinhardtii]PNW86630.1 hypothetical protein CHLRE_02g094426v5 [Chlamydomonas reinhardtii]